MTQVFFECFYKFSLKYFWQILLYLELIVDKRMTIKQNHLTANRYLDTNYKNDVLLKRNSCKH